VKQSFHHGRLAPEQSRSVALYFHLPTFVRHCRGLERKCCVRFIALEF
jgi:hypothetical protein